MARQIVKKGLTAAEHAALDHSEIPGAGGEETFTQEVHDSHDHTGIEGVLSEETFTSTEHESVDHTGLTGIPAAETFTEDVHAETSHDGLDGIGDEQWKAPVDDEASLPVNEETTQSTTGNTIAGITNINSISVLEADDFLGYGLADYSIRIYCTKGGAGTPTARALIYTNDSGSPGIQVAQCDDDVSITTEGYYDFVFSALDLTEETTYWIVVSSPDASETQYFSLKGNTGGGNAKYSTNGGSSWNTTTYDFYVRVSTTSLNAYEGDVRYAKSEKTVSVFDGTVWNKVSSMAGSWTSTNNTVEASSYRDIIISDVESALVTKLEISATDGNATPDMDYDIEIYEQAEMTSYAYVARGITDASYEDRIPWEWFGGTTMYIKIINNIATMIEELDLTINYRR